MVETAGDALRHMRERQRDRGSGSISEKMRQWLLAAQQLLDPAEKKALLDNLLAESTTDIPAHAREEGKKLTFGSRYGSDLLKHTAGAGVASSVTFSPVVHNSRFDLQFLEDQATAKKFECPNCYSITSDPERCPSCGRARS